MRGAVLSSGNLGCSHARPNGGALFALNENDYDVVSSKNLTS